MKHAFIFTFSLEVPEDLGKVDDFGLKVGFLAEGRVINIGRPKNQQWFLQHFPSQNKELATNHLKWKK